MKNQYNFKWLVIKSIYYADAGPIAQQVTDPSGI